MNNRSKKILTNSSYAIASNLLSMLISAIVVLVLPKIIGVESYGYWQLYLFYVSYVGFFHLGWIDGIYLKYGGQYYEELEQSKFFSQFLVYGLFQFFLALLIYLYGMFGVVDGQKSFIWSMLAITLVLTNMRFFVIYILQTTNRIKESSLITISDRLIYFCLILGFVFLGSNNYQVMIYADIIGRLVSLLYGIYLCKEIILGKGLVFKVDFLEIFDNIKIGSNLMLSNVASMLIIGIVRLGIEYSWDIETFGKLSLTLSISNLLMIFINAVGIVMFPMLRRIDQNKLPELYQALRNLLMIAMLAILLGYYPIRFILDKWLPNYQDSLTYMVLVFPLAIYEGKMSLLINTYLKALRMERYILRVNLITVAVSLFLTLFTTVIFKQLELAIITIIILLALRALLAELTIAKNLQISVKKDILLENGMVAIFILSGWFFYGFSSLSIYVFTYFLYLFMKIKEVQSSAMYIKSLLSKK